jgi:hypothetical protein
MPLQEDSGEQRCRVVLACHQLFATFVLSSEKVSAAWMFFCPYSRRQLFCRRLPKAALFVPTTALALHPLSQPLSFA